MSIEQLIREAVRDEFETVLLKQGDFLNKPQKPEAVIKSQIEMCSFLGITEPTIIRWRKKGKIPFLQIGSSIRYDLNAVIDALTVGKKKGAR